MNDNRYHATFGLITMSVDSIQSHFTGNYSTYYWKQYGIVNEYLQCFNKSVSNKITNMLTEQLQMNKTLMNNILVPK